MKSLCYACLTAQADTDDHIPPKCFFPAPRPGNLITVPCCNACNNGNSQEDAYVWSILTSLLDRSPAGEALWEEKVVGGYYPRNPKEIEALNFSLDDVTVERDGINIEAVRFPIDRNRLKTYFTRMTRGLIRHHYPNYDYTNSIFQVTFFQPDDSRLQELEGIRDLLKYGYIGDRVFQYRHGITDAGYSGLWMLVFYEALMVLVAHSNQTNPKDPAAGH